MHAEKESWAQWHKMKRWLEVFGSEAKFNLKTDNNPMKNLNFKVVQPVQTCRESFFFDLEFGCPADILLEKRNDEKEDNDDHDEV